jgi:hypothetical protein
VTGKRKRFFNAGMLQPPVCGRGESSSLQLAGLQAHERGDAQKEFAENTQDNNGKGVLQVCPRRRSEATQQQQRPQARQVAVAGPATMKPMGLAPSREHEQQATSQSVGAPNVNSLPLDNMLKVVVTVVQQILTEFNGALSEEAKIVAVTKIVLNIMKQNGHYKS